MYEDSHDKLDKLIDEFQAVIERLKVEVDREKQDIKELKNVVVDMKKKLRLLIDVESEPQSSMLYNLLLDVNLMDVRLDRELKDNK